jgi:thioredoxin-like negative regulator of GroEL
MDNKIIERYKNFEKVIIYIRSSWSGKCVETDKIIEKIESLKAYSEDTILETLDFDEYKDNLIELGVRLNPSIILLKYGKIENITKDIFGTSQVQALIKEILESKY